MIRPLPRPSYLPDRHFLLDIDLEAWGVAGYGPVRSCGGRLIAVCGIVSTEAGGLIDDQRHDVIAAQYSRSPDAFTRDLLGQYSAVIVDRDAGQVVIAQDSLGLGRAFVHRSGTRLLVASDLGALCAVLRPADLNQRFFAARLCIGASLGEDTPFKAVHTLSNGSLETHTPKEQRRARPWTPDGTRLNRTDEAAVEELRDLIRAAVQACLPLGGTAMAEVSGGLDSSTVVAMACALGVTPEGILFNAARGMAGNDARFATELSSALGIRLNVVDADAFGVVGQLRSFTAGEPSVELYVEAIAEQDRILREGQADVVLTGSAGDIVFDYIGQTPVFLADPVRRFNLPGLVHLARRYARTSGGQRSALHYIRTVALPFARMHRKGHSLFQESGIDIPAWVNQDFVRSAGLFDAPYPPRVSGLPSPSQQFLWESVYESVATENAMPDRLLSAQMVHPLYHRPLVSFLLALDAEVRRGFGAGRKLQRAAIEALVPKAIVDRRSKGSSQELRERHLLESDRWYDLMIRDPQLVEQGWVDGDKWRRMIDRTRVGAPEMTVNFTAAIDVELWLQTFRQHGFYTP